MICIIIIYITRSGKREGLNLTPCTKNIIGKDNQNRTVTYYCDSINGSVKRIRPGSLGITDYREKKILFLQSANSSHASIAGDCPPNWKKMNSYCAPPPSPSPSRR
jgi:hypothetical protein